MLNLAPSISNKVFTEFILVADRIFRCYFCSQYRAKFQDTTRMLYIIAIRFFLTLWSSLSVSFAINTLKL